MDHRPSRAVRNFLVIAAAVAAVACGASGITGTGVSPNGQIAWRVQNDQVILTNTSTQSVRFGIGGRTWVHSATIDWCFGMPLCGTPLSAGATATVTYASINGGEPPEREAMVFWWTPNGTREVGFDTAVVRIR